jgi:hypothetical protein
VIIVIGALGAVVQGVAAGFDLGCKLHWWSCSPCAGVLTTISPQSAPPAISPQPAPQQLLPGTKFQQR